MIGRWVVGGVVLLVVGGGAGAAAGVLMSDDQARISRLTPVPAESPSYPAGTVEVLPDPVSPALQAGLSTHPAQVGSTGFGVRLPVPDGWTRTDTDEVEAKWTAPDQPISNAFLLRAKLISSQRLSIEQAVEARLAALRAVVDDLEIEDQRADSFVVTYVSADHKRLAMERFLELEGTSPNSVTVQVTVAVVGRLTDRVGMAALLDQVVAGIKRAG